MVETPVPWNLHQPSAPLGPGPAAKGELVLDGPADLARFLDLCHEQKLLALVRIGPYVNAALTNGGLPAWLGDDPKLLIRSANERFIEAVRQYWAKLLPILVTRQVPGGPVALIQIEDHYRGPDERYLARLYGEVKDCGLRVPVVVSELNPCKDFQQVAVPDTPFYATTELMPGGPLGWGERRKGADGFGDILIEGLAKGVDGFNHAMWAAGTNLAVLPASSFPTRYEDATCGLLEAGGLGQTFPEAKKANWFARAFEGVLTQASKAEPPPFFTQQEAAAHVLHCRGSDATTILFAKRRYGQGELRLQVPRLGLATVMPLDATAFRHIVGGFPLTPEISLTLSTAQVFTIQRFPRKLVAVVYAPEKSEALMAFRAEKQPTIRSGGDALTWDEKAGQLVLRWKCAAKGERRDFVFQADVPIHIIAIEESQVPLAWVLDGAGILVGAPALGEWKAAGDNLAVELRIPPRRVHYALTFYPAGPQVGLSPATGLSEVKHDAVAGRIDCRLDLDVMEPLTLFLRKWETAEAVAEAASDFDDASWRETVRPEPLGQDHHGWFRARFKAARAATRKLILDNVADSATVYLNGQCVGQSTTKRLLDGPRSFPHPANFELSVKPGDNVLAILVKNWGCYRNTSAYGVPLNASSAWGILGNVALDGQPLGRWRQREGMSPEGRQLAWAPLQPKPETRDSKHETPSAPVRWFRTTFAPRKHPAHLAARLYLKGLSHGVLWLNGHYVGLYSLTGAEASVGCHLPTPWLRAQNELIVLEDGGQQPTEGEVRFDRDGTYVRLRLEFGPQAAPAGDPAKKGKARPKAAPKAKAAAATDTP